MKFIFLRHGTAEEKSPKHTELQDFKRKLVKQGKREIKRLMKKNPDVFKNIDMIFSSPFLRSLETAELIYEKHPSHSFEMNVLLEQQVDAKTFVKSLRIENDPKIFFVGHEPLLSNIIKLLLKSPNLPIDLKKGGAVLLEGNSVKELKLSGMMKP